MTSETYPVRVTIWNEFRGEREHESFKRVYPDGIHSVIAKGLAAYPFLQTRTVTLDDPEQGLSVNVLDTTDVLIWWGHSYHHEVADEAVERTCRRIREGMGLIVLHSGHLSKIFTRLMGTECTLRWRDVGEKERIWNIEPSHPIAEGIGEFIELPMEEMYGERFNIPTPDKLVFISWFEGGEVFRSGCCWERDHGRIFYFRPGHEIYPVYYNEQVIRVIANAAKWANRPGRHSVETAHVKEPLERIASMEKS
jgi:trehalose utilization protein